MAAAGTRAEMAVLGSVLIDPDCIGAVATLVAPADLAQPRLRLIYEAMLAVHARGERPDYVAVLGELEQRGTLAAVGGDWVVTHLINECPCSLYSEHYARLVQRGARRRGDPVAAGGASVGLAL